MKQLEASLIKSPFIKLFALLLLILISMESVSANVWQIETVDSEGISGFFSSLALDPTTGYPRISYYGSYNSDLKYAAYNGSSWEIETIDSAGNVGFFTSLALDPITGYPRISYFDSGNNDLKYASYDGLTWQIETVESVGSAGSDTSLALDPTTGYPRISYRDLANFDLKYAAYDGSTWQIETVDSAGIVGSDTSLVLDPITSYPRISYYDNTNDDLKYAAYDGSTWQIETIDNGGIDTSIALDPVTGYPRISYFYNSNSALKYAAYDGSTWQIETLDSIGLVGYFTSLALDTTTGYPRISYYDRTNGNLKYAAYDGSTWQIETVDFAGDVSIGIYTSLALDPTTGYPRISYFDASYGLNYASLLPTEPPSITAINIPTDPAAVNTVINVNGTFADPDLNDVHTAVWDWGDSTTSAGTITEAGGSGTVTGTHAYATTGNYTVTLTVTDSLGASDTKTAEIDIIVYDPVGGFATGNGWLNSLSGAYRGNPTLTGKVDFGFVSRYQKGATIPEGNTQFKFKDADLRFESTSYKWLVVNNAGVNAQLFGNGTINGGLAPNNEEYKFMIWATDGDPDTFRIKIWWEDNSGENIVYDNDMQQPIEGGAIQVHAK